MFRTIRYIILFAAALPVLAHAAVNVTATRVWPAADYTRITIEASSEISQKMLMLKDPDRLVLDLDGVELNQNLKALAGQISPNDPYIKQVRVANFKPGTVRVVIDLKAEIKPNIFMLQPAGNYNHRLVLDVYPLQDPLSSVLNKLEKQPEAAPTAEVKPPEQKPLEPKFPENKLPEIRGNDKPDASLPVVELPPEEVPEKVIEKPLTLRVAAIYSRITFEGDQEQ